MQPVTKQQLHERMVGNACTDDWDVLVSYSEQQLNDFLAREWSQRRHFANLYFRKEMPWHTQEYRLKFHPPTLRFETTQTSEPYASLEIPIEGTTWLADTGRPPFEILPGNYQFRVTVPIAGIHGDTNAPVSEVIINPA